MKVPHVLLFGAGQMSEAYASVLSGLPCTFSVFGRGSDSAVSYEKRTSISVETRPFEQTLMGDRGDLRAIIAVTNDQLASTTLRVIRAGIKQVLVEKPAGISLEEISLISKTAMEHGAKVAIGFNRRFYSSTLKAEQIIAADGGITSASFNFTEIVSGISKNYSPQTYRTWMLSNPIHVLDQFIYFCGRPVEWKCFTKGGLAWHPSSSIFTGAGITDRNILFNYHADWESAGRWRLELYTPLRKLIFCPVEELRQMPLGTFSEERVGIDEEHDITYKPGLFKQAEAFLVNDRRRFCSVEELADHAEWYYEVAGYEKP